MCFHKYALALVLAIDCAKNSFFAECIKFLVLFRHYSFWDKFLPCGTYHVVYLQL